MEVLVETAAQTFKYECTAVATLVLEGFFARKWIYPPESVGPAPGASRLSQLIWRNME